MRNVFLLSIFALLALQGLIAQNETRFYAEADAKEVAVGASFNLSFVLENGKNNSKFSPPDWEAAGFMVLGSNHSTNISISNGETNASAAYNFIVTPIREGDLIIPAVIIKNGDQELRTASISIKAIPNDEGVQPVVPKRSPEQPKSQPKRKFKTIKM